MNRDPLTRDADPFWLLLGISLLGMTGGAALVLCLWAAFGTWWP